jgi:CRP-like cAMP-binding protein
MEKLIDFLQHTLPIPLATAQAIAEHFVPKTLRKGELFLEAGQVSDEYLFLEAGCLRSYLYDTEGNEITLNFYAAMQPVFEVASFFQRIPSEEYIEAIADSAGCVITFEKLNRLFHTVPEFREIGRALLVKGFVQFKKRTLSMINKTAEMRYTELIQTHPQLFQYASLKHIASYLGVTDTSLSRIRSNFQKR